MDGFTLVEAIMVIAIIGIVSGMVAVFIRAPILAYRDTVDRAELTDQADLTLRRMARDIRLALPNSVRVMKTDPNGDVLEFLQTKAGGRYLSAEDGLPDTVPPLSFDDPAKVSFTALAPTATFLNQVRAGDYVVVYNLGEGFAPANAYDLRQSPADARCPAISRAGNIACITSIAQGSVTIGTSVTTATIGLNGNPFARQDSALASPDQRFQVVSGPVSYYCEKQADGTSILWRAWDYPIAQLQDVPPASSGKRAMVASRLASCAGIFRYGDSASASRRAGLVVIALEFRGRNDGAAAIRLIHQVHVDNTP